MPFLQEGDSVESDYVTAPPPAARLVVDPGKVLLLKRGIEEERERIGDWLKTNWRRLNSVRQPGSDPCSEETAKALSENGEAAVRAATGYVTQLLKVAEALGDIAKAYRLTEDENARRLERRAR